MKSLCQVRFAAVFLLAIAVHPLFAAYDAAGGYVTLLGQNLGSQGESTFMTNIVRDSYGWSDGRDPHSGTNYYCGKNAQLCSPKVDGGTFKFPGDSLTIGYRLIALATSTLNIDDFRLEKGGYIMTMSYSEYGVTIRGSLTVLGDVNAPSHFMLGKSPQHYKIESSFRGDSSAYAYTALASSTSVSFASFANQYVELDDAGEYYGTFEVRTNTCLKLASDLPGSVVVANGGCLTPVGTVMIGSLSLADGATVDFSEGGAITVADGFTASGTITVKAFGGTSYPKAVLAVPADCGTLDERLFAGEGVRFTVSTENGIQTLYAELLEPSVFDASTGYVTQMTGGTSSTSLKNIFDEPSAWSDNQAPHPDTNYYGFGKGIYITTNSVFAGRSLSIARTAVRMATVPMTIADLRVKSGNGYASSMFTSSGNGGKYYIHGGMTVLSRETDDWPFAFYGGADNLFWISDQKIMGEASRAFELRGAPTKAPGDIDFYVDLLGDLSEYYGTIIVGTNGTLRLGGSSMPGTIRLDTAYSHVDTIASDGVEVKVGKLVSRIGTSISVATTNILTITNTFSVTGTLTKNGGGVLASSGTILAGVGAALNVAEGGLRADAAHAFDGISVTFANGTTYVRDLATDDAELIQCGLCNTATVTALGVLNVEIKNSMSDGEAQEVALFTVPESCAEALLSSIMFSPRPKGCKVNKIAVDADSGRKTIKAVLSAAGMIISFK